MCGSIFFTEYTTRVLIETSQRQLSHRKMTASEKSRNLAAGATAPIKPIEADVAAGRRLFRGRIWDINLREAHQVSENLNSTKVSITDALTILRRWSHDNTAARIPLMKTVMTDLDDRRMDIVRVETSLSRLRKKTKESETTQFFD